MQLAGRNKLRPFSEHVLSALRTLENPYVLDFGLVSCHLHQLHRLRTPNLKISNPKWPKILKFLDEINIRFWIFKLRTAGYICFLKTPQQSGEEVCSLILYSTQKTKEQKHRFFWQRRFIVLHGRNWKSDTCFIAKLLSLLRKDEEQLRQSRGSQPTTTDPEGIRFGVLR